MKGNSVTVQKNVQPPVFLLKHLLAPTILLYRAGGLGPGDRDVVNSCNITISYRLLLTTGSAHVAGELSNIDSFVLEPSRMFSAHRKLNIKLGHGLQLVLSFSSGSDAEEFSAALVTNGFIFYSYVCFTLKLWGETIYIHIAANSTG